MALSQGTPRDIRGSAESSAEAWVLQLSHRSGWGGGLTTARTVFPCTFNPGSIVPRSTEKSASG